MNNSVDTIRDHIFATISEIFGIKVSGFAQIELGYLNLKWRIQTNLGDLFVKQYNKTRYPEHLMSGLEVSLTHQNNLHQKGIPCPHLFSYQGRYVLTTRLGERFVLMGLKGGYVIQAGTANEQQMYSLGQITGKMHQILNANKENLPLHWDIRSKENMHENWTKRWIEATSLQCGKTLVALEKQRIIIDRIDLDIFSPCEKGWGHWDLFVDNILFESDGVTAILDFDRMLYVYPEFDLSRAILSCCIEEGHIYLNRVLAFVAGYREFNELTNEKFIRSIKLTWWKEASWIEVEKEENSSPLRRFREENNWVADNWNQLENIFSEL